MLTAQILKKVKVSDGMGGYEDTWQFNEATEGYLDQMSANEVLATEKLGELADSIFICFDTDIDIKRTDRMEIDGKQYDVRDIDNPMHMGHHLEITLRYTE